ncbi:Mur ligase [Clavulina sp. PMI_390]|nr:Mur ligase [Clavulina sp. PMI_390]
MAINLGLERMIALLEHVPYSRPTIHVAGTNGKGSVSTFIESVLLKSGMKVGKFTSPHLVYVWDCITINGSSISQEEYEHTSAKIERLSDENSIGASSFELLTACAIDSFERAAVDVVVLEVGMGGRLDATNALPDSVMLISAITAIDIDHQAFLGSTISEIAREKAGIIRRNGRVVLGDQALANESDVYEAVKAVADGQNAVIIRAVTEIPGKHFTCFCCPQASSCNNGPDSQILLLPSVDPSQPALLSIRLGLYGAHQRSNARIAYSVLVQLFASRPQLFGHLTNDHVVKGLESARWPGRLSWHTINLGNESSSSELESSTTPKLHLLVDGAHNAASATTLAEYLRTLPSHSPNPADLSPPPSSSIPPIDFSRPPCTFILALSHSPPKTPESVLEPLLQEGDRVALVKFTEPVAGMPWVKNVPISELLPIVHRLVGSRGIVQSFETQSVDSKVVGSASNSKEDASGSLQRALVWAHEVSRSEPTQGTVVLAGSLYLVGDLYRYFELEAYFPSI